MRVGVSSKNGITVEQLQIVCRHVDELIAAGVTENFAIRTLELFADFYAKLHKGGSATPHHVRQVDLWSVEARKLLASTPDAKPRDHLRVEHGTPRRAFARLVRNLYHRGDLTEQTMGHLVERYWKLAVLTVEEDARLNKIARFTMCETPEERWAAAGIKFTDAV